MADRTAHRRHGIGRAARQRRSAQGGQIVQVVTDVGGLRERYLPTRAVFVQPGELVFHAGEVVGDAELAHARSHRGAVLGRYHTHPHPGITQHQHAFGVARVELLERLAVAVVVHAAVGQGAVHVDDQQADVVIGCRRAPSQQAFDVRPISRLIQFSGADVVHHVHADATAQAHASRIEQRAAGVVESAVLHHRAGEILTARALRGVVIQRLAVMAPEKALHRHAGQQRIQPFLLEAGARGAKVFGLRER